MDTRLLNTLGQMIADSSTSNDAIYSAVTSISSAKNTENLTEEEREVRVSSFATRLETIQNLLKLHRPELFIQFQRELFELSMGCCWEE